jgi:hypothetical protein
MGPNAFYAIQPAFTGGELSPDVASRVDLDKYQLALLQAENAIIRPYGAVTKRPGLVYCGEVKSSASKVLLYSFRFNVNLSYLLEFGVGYVRIWREGVYLNVELATPYTAADLPNLRFVQSVDVLYIASGRHPVKKILRYSESSWQIQNMNWIQPPMGDLNPTDSLKVTPSATTGTITLTASASLFEATDVGSWMELSQRVSGSSVSITSGTSSAIGVGDTWKVITHGTWKGTVIVESSTDNGATWLEERRYTGNEDYNPTESGNVDEYTLMRVKVSTTSGTCTCDFSAHSYTHTGYVAITAVSSGTSATAIVKKRLGATTATADWKFSAWDSVDGYPSCAAFFQDRLCFAGSDAYPQRVWMSKTGDYENFGVEKEAGTVTDDSAVTADLLSLQSYRITHMVAGNDLILLTEGNEWTIDGSETVTPTSISPRSQQSYGANDVIPIRSGNRIVYVQRRGSIVRDMGYSYDTDSYAGMDLSLLVRHLIRGYELKDSTYAQEPDSLVYFVRGDGMLLALTYLYEQKVYGWSHIVTDGEIESVCAVSEGNRDVVYVVVKRTVNGSTKRYIERFAYTPETGTQQDYIMLDSAKRYSLVSATDTITGLSHLEGKKVLAMGDGYLFDPLTVEDGTITLPQASKNVVVGLPYTMKLEQPNFETQTNSGTMQGREKAVTSAIFRLTNSFGGEAGPDESTLNEMIYDVGRLELGENVLYSGDLNVTMAAGGFNKNGRVFIRHDKPYPFTVSAIIRAVTFGGTGGLRN